VRTLALPSSGKTPRSRRSVFRVCSVAAARRLCDDSRVSRRVVIVDDHAPFRASARRLLELEGWTVVGEAADAESAVTTVERVRPDLVLLDIALPDGTGFDVAKRLTGGAAVVLVSSRDPEDFGARVQRSGAVGFIAKDELSGAALAALLEPRR
jgi:DNA-binding NarL/FixJ family response regulator